MVNAVKVGGRYAAADLLCLYLDYPSSVWAIIGQMFSLQSSGLFLVHCSSAGKKSYRELVPESN